MAVQQKQKRGETYKGFSARLPEFQYKKLEDYAWNNRISLAHAISILIDRALNMENQNTPVKTTEN